MKKKIILLIILLSIFMIGAVSASNNDTIASNSKLTKSISVDNTGDISNVKNSEVKDTNNVLKKDSSKKIVSQNNNHTKNKITHSSKTESYKDSYDDDYDDADDDYTDDYTDDAYEAVHDAYIKSKTVYSNTYTEINYGWKGNFEGYFKIYKGNEEIYSYYIEGYNKKYYTYYNNGLSVGKYTTKIISDDGQTVAKGKIVVKKVPSKISVKSFKTTSGTKFTCYAYLYNKKNNNYLNEGYVKFKIKGKTYKAKVKNGEAKIKFKVPQKAGKYICKAKYYGTKNTKNSKTIKFKMVVKKNSASKTKTTTIKIHKYCQRKKLKKGDSLVVIYNNYVETQSMYGVNVFTDYNGGQTVAQHTKLIKAKVWFKKKGKIINRVAKARDGCEVTVNLINGYTPYKVKIWYKIK